MLIVTDYNWCASWLCCMEPPSIPASAFPWLLALSLAVTCCILVSFIIKKRLAGSDGSDKVSSGGKTVGAAEVGDVVRTRRSIFPKDYNGGAVPE